MTESVSKPFDKIKRIRSWDEIVTRGGQAISVYREQRKAGSMPTDHDFIKHIERSYFGTGPIIAESLWQKFFRNGEKHFFQSLRDTAKAAHFFENNFGAEQRRKVIEAAEYISYGRIDLMGFKNLYVGTRIDWHREPLSAKRSPMQHWKQFDDLDSRETGDKKIVWELNRHQHFFTLGVAYCLTGDERFARTFVDHLDSWMDSNPPGIGINWSSSLEVAFRAMSWIWAFHLFRESDSFTPQLFKKALAFLYQHGRHIEQYLSKYYSPNTHLTGEALGLYYLGTQFPYFDRATQWRRLGEDILLSEIDKQVLPDGVYFEQSTWYQRYTADIFTHFVILRALSDDRYFVGAERSLEERLEKCFRFLRYVTMPDGRTPLIGDDDGGRVLPLVMGEPDDLTGTLAVGAVLFDNGDFKVWNSPSEEVFWLLGEEGVRSYRSIFTTDPEKRSLDFPYGGYAVMRDGWNDGDNVLIVDCGEVGALSGGHGHADTLSVEVAVHGQTLLVDSGTYTYHESKELRDYFRSTAAHNTLVIDNVSSSLPGHAFGWQTKAQAKRTGWINEDRFDYFAGSHDGYESLDDPATHHRSIVFLKDDYWVIRDLVQTRGAHEYSLGFHFAHGRKPSIGEGGKWIGEEDHRIYTFGDHGAWQQKESWVSNNHGNRVNAPFFRFISAGDGKQEFWTFLMPRSLTGDDLEVAEVPMVSGRAFVVKFGLYTDVFVFNDEPGQLIDTGLFDTDFKFSWARLTEDEMLPDEFVLIGGSRLRLSGRDVLDPNQSGHAAIRRLGSELYVKTGLGRYKAQLFFTPDHLR